MFLFIAPIIISLSSVLFSIFLDGRYSTQKIENIEIKSISRKLSKAVWVYLIKMYQLIFAATGVFAVLMFAVPAFGFRPVLGLVFGMVMSFIVNYFACIFIIRLNSRIVSRSSHGFVDSFNSIFNGGGLLALLVSGMAVLTVSSYYFIFSPGASGLVALSLGSVICAFFLKIGGRVYREKANFESDSHDRQKESRNPEITMRLAGNAAIRPLGLIADLYATMLVLIVAAMLASSLLLPGFGGGIALPLLIMISGLIASFAGTQLIKIGVTTNIFRNIIFTVLGVVIFAVILVSSSVLWATSGSTQVVPALVLLSSVLGLITGGGIMFMNYFINSRKYAKTLITGCFGVVIFAIVYANYWFGGWYNAVVFSVSMISLAGTALALHMFSSISAASKEIARLSNLPQEHTRALDKMDVVDDAVNLSLSRYVLFGVILGLLALSMLYDREIAARTTQLDFSLAKETTLAGIFLGAAVFYFLVYFIGRFMRNIKEKATYGVFGSVDYAELSNSIVSYSAKKTLVLFVIVVSVPLAAGLILRAEVLGGLLAGMIIFGGLWSVSRAFNKPFAPKKNVEGIFNDNYYIEKAASFYSPVLKLVAMISLLLVVFLA
ncbi:MAG: sodium/proton-translocating pyrophosphatase [Candidatus Spechtbacterales bacterium]